MIRSTSVLAALVLAALAAPGVIDAQQSPTIPTPTLQRKPDLKIKVILEKRQREGKWFVRQTFRVFNVGLGPAAPSTVGAWCLAAAGGPCPALDGAYQLAPPVEPGGTAVVKLPTPVIGPGASVDVLGPITKEWPNGNYTIKARADFLAVVPETIENNNQGQAAIAIP